MNEVLNALEADKELTASMRALYWDTMLTSLGHEFWHSKRYYEADKDERELLLTETDKGECAKAEEFARELLETLVKTGHNIEPPPLDMEPRLKEEIEFYHSVAKDDPGEIEPWVQLQMDLAEGNIMFRDGKNNEWLTFKSYLCATSDSTDDPSWEVDKAEEEAKQPVLIPEVVNTDEAGNAKPVEQVTTDASSEAVTVPPPPGEEAPLSTFEEPELGMDTDMSLDGMVDEMFDQMASGGVTSGEPGVHMAPADTAPVDTPVITNNKPVETATADKGVYIPPAYSSPAMGASPGNAGAVSTPVPNATLPILSLTKQQYRDVVQQVVGRLFYHLVGKCDFNVAHPTAFGYPQGVLEYGIKIDDIPHATEIFVACDTGDQATGLQTNVPTTDGIRGYLTKNMRIPAYSLWVNKAGVKTQLKFIPQNPQKVHPPGHTLAGQLKPYASKVKHQGYAVVWLMEETPKGQMSIYLLCVEQGPGQHINFDWVIDKRRA